MPALDVAGEFETIERLFKPLAHPEWGRGLLDDVAMLPTRAGHDLVATKDALVEGVHFLLQAVRDLLAGSGALTMAFWWTQVQEEAFLREQIVRNGRQSAQERIGHLLLELHRRAQIVNLAGEDVLRDAAELCLAVGADGLRGELTLMRAARALAALDGAKKVTRKHLIAIAPSALRHRLRRDVLDETGSTVRITRAIAELFG